ncbi:MAG TPA: ABC transporter substrate-binding protein [Chloroflexota bacterium]|jgi:NitT/TauT family transport system substrate-binding protein|nr:ABC transporter substrate-binding protein [Chloroflexota bacterium]
MAPRSLLARGLLVLLWLGSSGCGRSAPPPTAAPTAAAAGAPSAMAPPAPVGSVSAEPTPVRISVLRIIAEAGLFVAADRGYFAEVGLAPEFLTFESGARALPVLAAQQIEAASGGFSPAFVNAIQRGVNVKLAAGLASDEPGHTASFLLLRKDLAESGEVRDWPDLRGRTMAIPPGRPGLGEYMAARAVARGGLTLNDVDIVELPFADMVTALGNRTIDVAHTAEPLSTVAADRGVALKWRPASEYVPGSSPTMLTFGPSILDKPPDLGQRLMIAYLRGARDYNNAFKYGVGRPEIVQILINHTTVKDPTLYDRMSMQDVPPDGTINLANLSDQLAFYVERGALPDTIDVQSLLDDRYRAAAVQFLGPYRGP